MISAVLSLAGSLFAGWKKWLAVALGAVLLLGWIGLLKLQNANLRAENAVLAGDVKQRDAWLTRATADIQEAGRVNRDAVAAVDRLRAEYDAALAAIVADRDRLAAEAKSIKIVKERIHVEAQKCVGVPPAFGAVADWLRDNPDTSADGR